MYSASPRLIFRIGAIKLLSQKLLRDGLLRNRGEIYIYIYGLELAGLEYMMVNSNTDLHLVAWKAGERWYCNKEVYQINMLL